MYEHFPETAFPWLAIGVCTCAIIVGIEGYPWLGQPLLARLLPYPSQATSKEAPHRIWDVVELVEGVVAALSRGDQVRMAAVSHTTWSIAAPFIWKDLPQQRWNLHIFSILPHEVIDWGHLPESKRSLQAPPFPNIRSSAWERFLTHARWIRSLRLVLDKPERSNSLLLLQILRLGRLPLPLFPQLRHLSVQIYRFPLHRDDLSGLTTPSLRELEVNFFGYQPENPLSFTPSAVHLLHHLAQHSSLRSFVCRAASPTIGRLLALSTELCAVISQQPQLVELELVSFDEVFLGPFTTASRLRELLRISFLPPSSASTSETPVQMPLHNHPFPTLTDLEVATTPDQVTTLLESISSPQVRRLEILVQPQRSLDLMPGTLSAVPRFTTLTTISLHFISHTAQWFDLNPLLSCSRLIVVELSGPQLSDVVGNKEIEAIARGWVDLERLLIRDIDRHPSSLRSDANNVKAPLATLGGLYPFAAHCPRMRELDLSIDASSIGCGEQEEGVDTLGRHTTQILRLPCSFVDGEADNVAEYILKMWPRLELEDDQGDPYLGSENELTARMGERWARIWDRVEELGSYA